MFHLLRLVVPQLHLLRILLHLHGKIVVDSQVLVGGIHRGTLQAFLHNREAVEHLVGYIQRKHGHQDDIHQINHLLARGYWSFLYCHGDI